MTLKKITTMIFIVMVAMFSMSQVILAELPSTGESNATVKFTPATTIPEVVDPTDPTEPFEPTEPNPTDPPTGNVGPLSLDYVSSIDFGVNEISAETEVYHATSMKPFIQITDRRGTGEGWNVTAQMTEFTTNDILDASLPGAILTLSNGEALPALGTPVAPTSIQSVILSAGGAATQVISAPIDTGLGTWINRWFPTESEELNDNVALSVPATSAMVGDHAATITWTLTDGPGQ